MGHLDVLDDLHNGRITGDVIVFCYEYHRDKILFKRSDHTYGFVYSLEDGHKWESCNPIFECSKMTEYEINITNQPTLFLYSKLYTQLTYRLWYYKDMSYVMYNHPSNRYIYFNLTDGGCILSNNLIWMD